MCLSQNVYKLTTSSVVTQVFVQLWQTNQEFLNRYFFSFNLEKLCLTKTTAAISNISKQHLGWKTKCEINTLCPNIRIEMLLTNYPWNIMRPFNQKRKSLWFCDLLKHLESSFYTKEHIALFHFSFFKTDCYTENQKRSTLLNSFPSLINRDCNLLLITDTSLH